MQRALRLLGIAEPAPTSLCRTHGRCFKTDVVEINSSVASSGIPRYTEDFGCLELKLMV